ncbi:serine/threonine-protein kinase [Nannocystis sp. RBIL2]|uniref:serine/threonine-protein kinase n=1 Tax=Nannocystis sp. RBIL2 TaxID=2996788 RepID=UPI00227067C0|nr:serine/threonine-protein kinase [Nannocystis sp. RBIL2]
MRESDPLVGAVLGDKLPVRIVRRLGEGGMGTVYLAESTEARLPYAVKVLQPRLCRSEPALRRFFREALAASSIRHPGVISVVDAGHLHDGTGYYVMEFLAGEDLSLTLMREGRLAWRRVRHVALQICDAMAVVHAHGIVHRDLKPANCFRTIRGTDDDAIKILDFGVAKIATQSTTTLTGDGAFLGTVAYMAPELLRAGGAREGDARGDVWALGVILHELLAGTRPFGGEDVFQLMAEIQSEPPSPLVAKNHAPDWPDALETVLARALAKDPRSRFADMRAFAEALQELPDGRPLPRVERAREVVDPLAATAAADGQASTSGSPEVPQLDALQQVRQRATFYVKPSSRWRPEAFALPGSATLIVLRTDLRFEEVDAIVCGITSDGPVHGTLARSLCEFGGPEVAAAVMELPQGPLGSVQVVAGGRLPAARVFFVHLPQEFAGSAGSEQLLARVATACLEQARCSGVQSLTVPLLLSGAFGMPRRTCLLALVAGFEAALATMTPYTLGMLRVAIDDGGRLLARHGELIVELPEGVAELERVQRFVLGRHASTGALMEAIWSAIPARVRPPFAAYGSSWSLRRAGDEQALEAALVTDPQRGLTAPADAGLRPGVRLRLGLHALEGPAAAPDALRSRCAVIHWTAATDGERGEVAVPCFGYDSTQELLDHVWASFPPHRRPLPRTYGSAWLLRRRGDSEGVPLDRSGATPVAAVGFVPGSEFEVVLLKPGR